MPVQSFHIQNVLFSIWSSEATKKLIRLMYLFFSAVSMLCRFIAGLQERCSV